MGFEEEYLLPIPKNPESSDYTKFLKNTLNLLADIYEISIEELEVIIEEDNAILSIRIHDNQTEDGKIGFKRFEELIEGLKDLLVDTASFVMNPDIQINSKPAEAYRYLNYCKFLQTEVGSFIAKIELPSDEIIREPQLFDAPIIANQINTKLKSVLSYVQNSVFNSNGQFDENHLEENQENINLNLLKDIEKIYDKTESRNIEFYFSDIQDSVKINTENIYNDNLIKLTNLIESINESLSEENQRTLVGRIITLKSADPEGERNEITFGSLLDNMPIKVKASLSRENYQEAVDAHKDKRNIQITGVLKKLKTMYKFIEVQEFQIPE
ncbi:hypothetical protein [Maribacter zhoushanensis]|uniref:hypothetical protein n=1 Tax=Maribacter zhoushanensis TaxID=3030012 RepID=UPI0023EC7A88|nr:hypothetical protein [Maribacter zhoushanensis]